MGSSGGVGRKCGPYGVTPAPRLRSADPFDAPGGRTDGRQPREPRAPTSCEATYSSRATSIGSSDTGHRSQRSANCWMASRPYPIVPQRAGEPIKQMELRCRHTGAWPRHPVRGGRDPLPSLDSAPCKPSPMALTLGRVLALFHIKGGVTWRVLWESPQDQKSDA